MTKAHRRLAPLLVAVLPACSGGDMRLQTTQGEASEPSKVFMARADASNPRKVDLAKAKITNLSPTAGAKPQPTTPPAGQPKDLAPPAEDAAPKPIAYPAPYDGKPLSTRTTASGLKVETFVEGTGKPVGDGAFASVHYTGWTSKGVEFDSSFKKGRPHSFSVGKGRVIKGWDEVAKDMKVGDKIRVTIPPEMAYGDKQRGRLIPANSTLIFIMEMTGVMGTPKDEKAFAGAAKSTKKLEGMEIQTFAEGAGTGAKNGDTVHVHYTGKLDDGTVFDASIPRGQPISFPLGQGRVIKGWDKGIEGMKVGGLRKLVIPPDLAYGETARGKIPANATLTFTVELMKIDAK